MTHSVPRRKDDLRRALVKMVEVVADDYLLAHPFTPGDPNLGEFLPTTWRELIDADLAERHGRDLILTPSGWLTGLRISGRLESVELRARAQAVVRALKSHVKGRQSLYDEFVDTRDLATELGLPEGWLTNALDAKLLERVFPKDRMNARLDSQHRSLVRIPPTFNSDAVEVE